jgi:hypothetical protein
VFESLWKWLIAGMPTDQAEEPQEKPTERQRRYAAVLGLDVPANMSKWELSALIGEAEKKNPSLAAQREKAAVLRDEMEYGKEAVAKQQEWNRFAENTEYMLAIYRRGSEIIVDVLRVNEASIDKSGAVKLGVAAPKLRKDPNIGDYLEWEKEFELAEKSLLFHKPLHAQFHDDGVEAYRKNVETGLVIAPRFR